MTIQAIRRVIELLIKCSVRLAKYGDNELSEECDRMVTWLNEVF